MKRAIPLAMLAALACARSGELRVLADSTTGPGAVEVLAFPVDQGRALVLDPARAPADSLAARYRRDRALLNARADSLSRVDRRTTTYAAAYETYLADAKSAEILRAARDSARRRLPAPRPLPDSLLARAVRAPLGQGAATMTLRAGSWWIGIGDARGALVMAPRRVEIEREGKAVIRF